MATYIPVLKIILPLIAPIISAAVPYFTKNSEKNDEELSLQEKQISELQIQVKKNVEHVQILATQLQQAITAFDEREINDQKNFISLNDTTKLVSEQNQILKAALEKSIKDAQITKYLALSSLFVSLTTIVSVFLK